MARNVHNPSGYHSSGRTLMEKAINFGKFIKQFGWTGKANLDAGTKDVTLEASRGENELITIYWAFGGGGTVQYTLAGETIKLLNVSAAAKIAQEQPDTSRLRKAVRRKRKELGVVVDGNVVTSDLMDGLAGSLPFDHESSDTEIRKALVNKQITWVNRKSGHLESAVVGPKQFKVVHRDPRNYIDFVYPIQDMKSAETFGFRSVYLDSIVRVG